MRYATLIFVALPLAAQTRIASDFEMQQMERQVAKSRDFRSQLSGHLNLGDLHVTRNETALARVEYAKAYAIASDERVTARRASQLTRYADATAAAALAEAKLGDPAHAFTLAEEAMRYASDSATSWNLYANTMSLLHEPAKAAAAARNAVALAEQGDDPLELAIDRYSLAASLIETGDSAEAERLLTTVVAALGSPELASVRKDVKEHESFEIYSTVRGNESAYVSLLNRAQLRLARLYEDRGDANRARALYQRVLDARSDEPTALAGMARLARNDQEREQSFIDAFNANPFSISLIREYQRSTTGSSGPAEPPQPARTPGDRVRLALEQTKRGDFTAARSTLDALANDFPNNDTIALLRRELEKRREAGPVVLQPNPTAGELRAIAAAFQDGRLTPEQRARLDTMTFAGTATFAAGAPAAPAPDQTVFESGWIAGVPFRFSQPTAFQGTFPPNLPLRLAYRIVGATRVGEADGLLIEPVRLEPAP